MYAVQCSIAIAVTLPLIDACGVAASYAMCALIVWISYGYVVLPKKNEMDLLLMI